jgi:dTDP-4-amino-4,6-dideoxygalactose transaminase
MDAILALAERFNLIVIEDACQAHGAQYFSRKHNRWMTAGSMGKAAAFSFYPGKNLGACGEAGAVTTNDEAIAAQIRMIRDHGQAKKYYHNIEGYNGRLDAIQAGLLHVKLQHLAKWNEQRRERAMEYQRLFESSGNPVNAPYEPSWSRAVFHLYVVRTKDREGMMDFLKNEGIATGIHYPIPLHMQKAYDNLSYAPGDFPVSERVAAEIVSLPMFPQLTADQQAKVAKEVKRFVQSRSSKPVAGEAKDLAVAERMA